MRIALDSFPGANNVIKRA